jgi:hypothetical protein
MPISLHTRRVLAAARASLEGELADTADVRRMVAAPSPTGGTTKAARIVARDVPVSVSAGGGGITVTADQAESITFLEVRAPLRADIKRGDELLVYPEGDRDETPAVVRVVSIIRPDTLGLLARITARQVTG